MTTPDRAVSGGPTAGVEELRLLQNAAPSPGASPSIAQSSPGVSSTVARHPGAPTLPEPDPFGFASLLAQAANALFQAPPGADGAAAATLPAASVSDSVPASAPTPHGSTFDTVLPSSTGSAPAAVPSAPLAPALVPAPRVAAEPAGAPVHVVPAAPAIDPGHAPQVGATPFSAPLNFSVLANPVDAVFPIVTDGAGALTAPSEHPYWLADAPAAAAPSPTRLEVRSLPAPGPVHRSSAQGGLDPHLIRRQFPILHQQVHGKPLVWLDNAATTQKPQVVIDRLSHFYEHENSNIHRAAHTLAARSTEAYERARESVRRTLNAASVNEIVFVRGATEGINLVANTWGRQNVREGDEIVITWLEHHANIVPWQMLCAATGARLRVVPVDDSGQIRFDAYAALLGPRTRLVAMTQVSNALGTITPAPAMIELAHRHGIPVLLDGAQGISHMRVDVQALGCDFYVFSGHKVFAPTGIGAVYARQDLLEQMIPWQGGGNMIQDVTFEHTRYHGPPARFEAGTGNIADAVGLGAALDWLQTVGVEQVSAYEHALLHYATERLHEVPGLTLYGTAPEKAGVLSFVLAGQKTENVSALLDEDGIAVRSGHHCAQPILRRFGLEATVRASLAPYNTYEDIDVLVASLHRLQHGSAGTGNRR